MIYSYFLTTFPWTTLSWFLRVCSTSVVSVAVIFLRISLSPCIYVINVNNYSKVKIIFFKFPLTSF